MPITDNISETVSDTWHYFENHIAKVEAKRKAALLTVVGSFFSAWIIFILLTVCAKNMFDPFTPRTIGYYIEIQFLLSIAFAFFVYRLLKRGVWLAYKPLSHLIAKRILGPAYRAWGIIEVEELQSHGIIPDHCRVYREEGYILNIHGYSVRFQEIDAVRSGHVDSVREWYETSMGSGLYIDVELKRRLSAHTILISRGMHSYLKIFIRRHRESYRDVGLVSPRFADRFIVLSTDQIEARMAFHPAFIEKFMDIATHLNTKHVEASFLGDKLLIHARYKKDLFQIGHLFRPLRQSDIALLIQELNLYDDIIETLNLNPYTAP